MYLNAMNLDLFQPEENENVLPYDGIVKDYGLILNDEQSQKYLNYFYSIWRGNRMKCLFWGNIIKLNGKWHGMAMSIINTVIQVW